FAGQNFRRNRARLLARERPAAVRDAVQGVEDHGGGYKGSIVGGLGHWAWNRFPTLSAASPSRPAACPKRAKRLPFHRACRRKREYSCPSRENDVRSAHYFCGSAQ